MTKRYDAIVVGAGAGDVITPLDLERRRDRCAGL
jgi:choline dehydrogenase-like flavoprotein